MELNLTKCHNLVSKAGDADSVKMKIGTHTLEEPIVENDLEIMVSRSLTWTEQATLRAQKAVSAFFLLKKNIVQTASLS